MTTTGLLAVVHYARAAGYCDREVVLPDGTSRDMERAA